MMKTLDNSELSKAIENAFRCVRETVETESVRQPMFEHYKTLLQEQARRATERDADK